ncbi:MAG: TetR/AcrR family transcriptional regulator [Mycobacteriales bacterium]
MEVLGRRDRKKRQTRDHIAGTALALFAERGFEGVTVAEVARHADVAPATVFNHFPTKEDLVYRGMEDFEAAIVDAVRTRPPGRSAPAAFAAFLAGTSGLLRASDPDEIERLVTISRIIAGSPALLAREQQIFDHHTETLAGVLAAETGAEPTDITPWVVANALLGVHRAVVGLARREVLAGRRGPALARAVADQAAAALAVLERGLAGYPATEGTAP